MASAAERWSAFFRALTWCALVFAALFWLSVSRDEELSVLLLFAGGIASVVAFVGLVVTGTRTYRWLALGLILANALGATGMILPRLTSPDQPGGACGSTLSQVGKAMFVYSQANADYLPFDEKGPLHSLCLLYPECLKTGRVFQCPMVGSPIADAERRRHFPSDSRLAGAACDYGYTWRVSANPFHDFVVMADVPGNHEGGFHVLYADGHVKFQTTPFCSHDPADNIFSPEPGWSPDTDSYIRQE